MRLLKSDVTFHGLRGITHILSQTVFLFDYFSVQMHALSTLFHLIKSAFIQASNYVFVLTICLKLA